MKTISFTNCGDINNYIKETPKSEDKYCLMLLVTADEKENLYKMLDAVKKTIELAE